MIRAGTQRNKVTSCGQRHGVTTKRSSGETRALILNYNLHLTQNISAVCPASQHALKT